jgi:hypothetical protein
MRQSRDLRQFRERLRTGGFADPSIGDEAGPHASHTQEPAWSSQEGADSDVRQSSGDQAPAAHAMAPLAPPAAPPPPVAPMYSAFRPPGFDNGTPSVSTSASAHNSKKYGANIGKRALEAAGGWDTIAYWIIAATLALYLAMKAMSAPICHRDGAFADATAVGYSLILALLAALALLSYSLFQTTSAHL